MKGFVVSVGTYTATCLKSSDASLIIPLQMMVVLSGLVAFMVNLSIFWIIGKTSPLTYVSMYIF